jgi:hypothetical protein
MGVSAGVDCDGIAGNDNRMVCAIEAVKAANQAAADPLSAVDETGAGQFSSSSAPLDVDRTTAGTQLIVAPDFDSADANATPDLEDAVSTLTPAGGTNFFTGLTTAATILDESTNTNQIVIFISDGLSGGPNLNTFDTNTLPANTVFESFAIGTGVSCTTGSGSGLSLNDVAALTPGGSCTQITNFDDLADAITQSIGSTLDSLELEVDGAGASEIPNSEIDPDLPKDGPAMVDNLTTATGLGFGTHEICVTASGTDAGGEGDVTECVDIEVKEFEKFYTHTNNNWDDRCDGVVFEDTCVDNLQDLNDIGFRLPNVNLDDDIFADQLDQNGDGAYVLLGKENPKKTVVTPGQYIAVSEVTVVTEQTVWIEEDFGDCLEIGDVNPRSVPGGVQVVLVLANGDVIDIDDDLALGIGGSIILDATSATVHVDVVPAEATLRVMLKFGPNHEPGMVGLECTNVEKLLDDIGGTIAEASAVLVIEEK